MRNQSQGQRKSITIQLKSRTVRRISLFTKVCAVCQIAILYIISDKILRIGDISVNSKFVHQQD